MSIISDEFNQPVVVAAAALNQMPMDWDGNRRRIFQAIALAKAQQAKVLCLPELCISGYGCEDAFHGDSIVAWALDSLQQVLPHTEHIAVIVGLPIIHQNRLYNGAALLANQQVVGVYTKQVLAGYGVYYEPRWFSAWPSGVVDSVLIAGQSVPIGDITFNVGGVKLGIEICEDAWRSTSHGSKQSRDLICNPSASHFAKNKYLTIKQIVQERSRHTQSSYLYCNLLGNEAGRLIFDGAALLAENGALVAEQQRFSFQAMQLLSMPIYPNKTRLEQRRSNYPQPVFTAASTHLVEVDFNWQTPESLPHQVQSADVTHQTATAVFLCEKTEFLQAAALGLWDYLRKSKGGGYAISLSGGIDSSVTAILCGAMVRLALNELGLAGVQAALEHISSIQTLAHPFGASANRSESSNEQWENQASMLTRLLVDTAYQHGANSSSETQHAAQLVAAAVGARHHEWSIQPMVAAYETLSTHMVERALAWETDDIARQNIQARVRAPAIWLLANLKNRILLTTSNRSEAGVGYFTMDGDSSGGLAPIAGVSKSFLTEWMVWLSQQATLPAPFQQQHLKVALKEALTAVLVTPSTAELRPHTQAQKDEVDLMPYALLDAIEQAAIRDKMSPLQVWHHLKHAQCDMDLPKSGLSKKDLAVHLAAQITKFFRLWSQSQWKRERIAVSFHLDDENLDPRTWCRFPTLNAGWQSELNALAQMAEAE